MTQTEPRKWIGKPVPRREDKALAAGAGKYVADINLPGMLHMVVLRSPHAHARLVSIDIGAAQSHPAVHAVITAKDIQDTVLPFPVIWQPAGQKPFAMAPLASKKVRYVGEPIAVLVADSPHVAEDARELIEVEYDPLPAVIEPEQALAPGAPVINEEWGDNVAARYSWKTGDTDATFADAAIVVRGGFRLNRYAAMTLETRGLVATWDAPTGILTLWSGSQAASLLRTELAVCLGLPDNAIRIFSPNIGGGFGAKWDRYPEDLLVCAATRMLERPVKWIEDRREHFQGMSHAREQIHDWEMALDDDGHILGLRGTIMPNSGAGLTSSGIGTPWLTGCTMPNQYKFENYSADVLCVATNKVPYGAYRGFGVPESNFAIERLMDKAARRLGIDPAELRRRNLVQPGEMPYTNPSGQAIYDSGDYPEAMRRALERVGYDEIRAEQPALRERGIYRGVGISCFVHITGFGPSAVLGIAGYNTSGYEGARVHIDPGGKVTVFTGMIPIGQGIETTISQVTAETFGIDLEDVRIVWGDTSQTPYSGFGSGGSRSNVLMNAVMNAGDELKAKMIRIAAHLLEANPDDMEFVNGRVGVRGAPASGLSMSEVARSAYLAHNLPDGEAPMLETLHVFDPPVFEWGYGCHVGVIDVDVETGTLTWVRYVIVDDCGEVINPLIVDGQVQGGTAQGIGGALLENFAYDESGQLLTSSFMDYLMPSFHDVPDFELEHLVLPAPMIRGGFKGIGEAGCMPPAAVVANAVVDALAPFDVEVDNLPVTPNAVWRLLESAGAYSARAPAIRS
jgi:carbon-monoxide dehydrogenase large subunit